MAQVSTAHTETVTIDLRVDRSEVKLVLIGVEINCAEEIVEAVTKSLLNNTQRERRSEERIRIAEGEM